MTYHSRIKFHGSDGNSKIGKIANINLLCGDDDIKGRTDVQGSCQGCCSTCKDFCYGMKSYRYTSALEAHSDNTKFAREDLDGFFEELKKWVKGKKCEYVRYHSHGEILSKEYLDKMIETANEIPNKTFYVYTKRYKWVREAKDRIPANLTVLLSPPFDCKNIVQWQMDNKVESFPVFVYDDGTNEATKLYTHCPAVDKNGHKTGVTCDKCKRCPSGLTSAVYAH